MCTILIVDDDQSHREMLRTALEMKGYIVDVAKNGKVALGKYVCSRPDLIITDIVMPEMDGLEMIRKIRKEVTNTKIIAVSGDHEIGELGLESALVLGVDYILTKPFDTSDLFTVINSELGFTDAT